MLILTSWVHTVHTVIIMCTMYRSVRKTKGLAYLQMPLMGLNRRKTFLEANEKTK